jgi:branched-chain amino acid transport system permease protein
LWGSVFGALLLTVLPEALHAVKEYNVLVYGLILMGVLVFFPHGLLTGIAGILRKREKGVSAGVEKSRA